MSPAVWSTATTAVLLLVAAVLVGWPLRSARSRRGAVMTAIGGSARSRRRSADEALIAWVTELRRPLDDPSGSPDARPERTAHAPVEHGGALPAGSSRGSSVGPARAAAPDRPQRVGVLRRQPTDGAAPVEAGAGWPVTRDVAPGAPGPTGQGPGPGRAPGPTGPPGRRDGRAPAGLGGTPVPSVTVQRERVADPSTSSGSGRLGFALGRAPRRTLLLAGLTGAGLGGLLGGPVASVALATYGMLGVRAAIRWKSTRQVEQARRRRLDQLCGFAADLRAGLPVPALADPQEQPDESDRLRRLASAAVRLADRTGAPLADLVERIESDARSVDRGLAAAAAQAAGARATAWLLAGLPLGGIGLGYGIGVDPVHVLLHTPVGGVCTVLAVGLQAGGLFWAERLSAAPARAA
ncbi:hypothetical protein [Micromonospora avicenniae]|uniref:Tight adherence protein B n=1 Tax=Micromonospora avicenniae TaxID=1198245 RepID=A0A1N6ZCZ4_9ACTN|nr:hypothetical protein [Micromonospora avicenniae]SIR24663.1 hypothetical protein SAMN05444858_107282 [Micromonospora avicenniae]